MFSNNTRTRKKVNGTFQPPISLPFTSTNPRFQVVESEPLAQRQFHELGTAQQQAQATLTLAPGTGEDARRRPEALAHGDHRNREIPAKHVENGEHSRIILLRAPVHARVSILDMSRSAPRMFDQKPYRRLNSSTC